MYSSKKTYSQETRETSESLGGKDACIENKANQSKDWKNTNQDKDSEVLPMFGAMFIASCLGGPVCVLAGMKLGLFAAVGGGMVGYTTGKMFAESG